MKFVKKFPLWQDPKRGPFGSFNFTTLPSQNVRNNIFLERAQSKFFCFNNIGIARLLDTPKHFRLKKLGSLPEAFLALL